MGSEFTLVSEFAPKGDQPKAIEALVKGLQKGLRDQVLLGVTGSGKTFTMANVITRVNRPTLVIAPNKTLAAQLYSEFKDLFPENAVEYFVSYYDYYQPEAYIPHTDTYIEKDSSINEEIDKMRHSATYSLLQRKDVIIVASVSCIYGLGSPSEYGSMLLFLRENDEVSREEVLKKLVEMQYERNDIDFHRGVFRVKGDVIEIFPAYEDSRAVRIELFGDTVDSLSEIDPLRGTTLCTMDKLLVYPASHYVTSKNRLMRAMEGIKHELKEQVESFRNAQKLIEAQRIEERTHFDLEMIIEMGYCNGIENYSRYLDGRKQGDPPYTLLDYFPQDFLVFIDESHITIPQLHGMFKGDKSRKTTLVEYGFRLPSALDNRPLMFEEFSRRINQVIYVSATPAEYELRQIHSGVVEQIIRPTGLMDPEVVLKPATNQVDDLLSEIQMRVERGERTLVTTLTKRMAEDLTEYYRTLGLRVKYLHSEIDTLERVSIIRDLRLGKFDILIGINLLREGLDIPEVSLVAILDADKEGFLRSEKSLIQTCGRAARNINGRVVMYGDTLTTSLRQAISETKRRRAMQLEYNKVNKITPKSIKKQIGNILTSVYEKDYYTVPKVAEAHEDYILLKDIPKIIKRLKKDMRKAAKNLEFELAANLRDRMRKLEEMELTLR
ncbi:MAG: excinuclease ABC subunit UvrB [Thermodesulfobacteriota bacterium]|nr:excinuclease ABC subunit UvrB [Thermodesulfobacteriota bacterium]